MPYPRGRTWCSTAAEISVSLLPSCAAARPCHSDCSHTSIRSRNCWGTVPTGTVIAESPCQPSTIAPQSMEMMSPSRSARPRRGIPWTTSSLMDAQIDAGKGGRPYPLKEGIPPSSRIDFSAIASRSPVVIPGSTAARSFSRARATTSPATRIFAISPAVLIWTCSRRATLVAPVRIPSNPVVPLVTLWSHPPVTAAVPYASGGANSEDTLSEPPGGVSVSLPSVPHPALVCLPRCR